MVSSTLQQFEGEDEFGMLPGEKMGERDLRRDRNECLLLMTQNKPLYFLRDSVGNSKIVIMKKGPPLFMPIDHDDDRALMLEGKNAGDCTVVDSLVALGFIRSIGDYVNPGWMQAEQYEITESGITYASGIQRKKVSDQIPHTKMSVFSFIPKWAGGKRG